MNEFEFTCPACGQTIVADSRDCGQPSTCPHCQLALTVPSAPAAAATSPPNPPVVQRTSKLAIASLVCGLFMCLGSIPGIICGHMARRRIRRDPTLKGLGLANAGLILSYLCLVVNAGLLGSCGYRTYTASRQAWREVQQQVTAQMQTNTAKPSVPVDDNTQLEMAEETITNDPADDGAAKDMAPAPAPVTNHTSSPAPAEPVAARTGWTLDLLQADFPNHSVSGTFRGTPFLGKTFRLRGGSLFIGSREGSSWSIALGVKKGDPVAETSYTVQPSDAAPACRISLGWREEGNPTMQRIAKGYAMKLEFGKARGNRLPGKLYLCLPDGHQSYLAGRFTVSYNN